MKFDIGIQPQVIDYWVKYSELTKKERWMEQMGFYELIESVHQEIINLNQDWDNRNSISSHIKNDSR